MASLTFPAPLTGSKRQVAHLVWAALGAPEHYIECFGGGLNVLLGRPDWHQGRRFHETAGDANGRLVHLYRALQFAPEQVAQHVCWPSSEVDYHARHAQLRARLPELLAQLLADPRWCDPELAAWELWGLSIQIGQDWLKTTPMASRWQVGAKGLLRHGVDVVGVLRALSARLRNVGTLYGDWQRTVSSDGALTGAVFAKRAPGAVGVFLDPPYTPDSNRGGVCPYGAPVELAAEVRAWCLRMGDQPWLRIVLAGNAGEHQQLELEGGWLRVDWTPGEGMGGAGWCAKGQTKARAESLWLSPHCLSLSAPRQLQLLA